MYIIRDTITGAIKRSPYADDCISNLVNPVVSFSVWIDRSTMASTYLGALVLANTLRSRSNVPESKSGQTSILWPLESTTCRAQAPRALLLPFVPANAAAINRLSCLA
jgi:hypothetical protein